MTLFALTPLLFSAALAMSLARRREGADWREVIVASSIATAVACVLLTEVLSVGGWLGRVPLLVGWLSLAIVVLACTPWRTPLRVACPRKPDGVLAWLGGSGLAFVFLILLATAWVAPPNNMDAMEYHMPRVCQWAWAGRVFAYPTADLREATFPPLAEYGALHLLVLAGSDRWVNLLQWGALGGIALAASLFARDLGASGRGQWASAVFSVTLPTALLQASVLKNDLLLAYWVLCTLWLLARYQGHPSRTLAVAMGVVSGLAMLTKFSAPFYLLLPALWTAWRLRDRGWALLRHGALAVLLSLVVASPILFRNTINFGRPQGPTREFGVTNEVLDPRVGVSNLSRATLAHLRILGGGSSFDTMLWGVIALHDAMGITPVEPMTTVGEYAPRPFRWNDWHANQSGDPVHGLIALAVTLALLLRPRDECSRRALGWLWMGWLSAVLFACVFKHTDQVARYHLPMFIAASGAVAVGIERVRSGWLAPVMALLLLLSLPPLLCNRVRPWMGGASMVDVPREERFLMEYPDADVGPLRALAGDLARSGDRRIGWIAQPAFEDYIVLRALAEADPGPYRVEHLLVVNESARLRGEGRLRLDVVLLIGSATSDSTRWEGSGPRPEVELEGARYSLRREVRWQVGDAIGEKSVFVYRPLEAVNSLAPVPHQ